MHIVVIGAGSLRIMPALLADLFVDEPCDMTLRLVDIDLPMAELMAHVARKLASEAGAKVDILATDDRRAALPGADVVIFAAAVLGQDAWEADRELLKKAGLEEQVRDCGGLSGLMYTLRGAGLAHSICADMRELCPQAWLVCVANPMARIVTAARQAGIRAVGCCDSARIDADGYAGLARLVGRPTQQLEVVTAGLNRFAWLVSVCDVRDGEDLMPQVIEHVRAGAWGDLPKRWLDWYGGVMMGDPAQHADCLPTQPDTPLPKDAPLHRNEEARIERIRQLAQVAVQGKGPIWDALMVDRLWERPGLVAKALCGAMDLRLPMLNLPNQGYLPQLRDGVIVEVPVRIEGGVIFGTRGIELPDGVASLCEAVSETHELAARAASGDRAALREAIEIDPALLGLDRIFVQEVADRLLQANAPLLPHFREEDI